MISAVLLACLLAAYAGLHYVWALKERQPGTGAALLLVGAALPLAYLQAPSYWLQMGLRVMAALFVLTAFASRGIARAGERPLAALHLPLCLTMAALAAAASLN